MSILIGAWAIIIAIFLLARKVVRKYSIKTAVSEKQLQTGIIPDFSDFKDTPFRIIKCDF